MTDIKQPAASVTRNRTTYYLRAGLVNRVARVAAALGHTESSFLRHHLEQTLPAVEERAGVAREDG